MTWLASIAVAILSGLLTMVAAGFVATLAVDWHRISSFEGNSGYFVVGLGLVGLVGGLLVGFVVSRYLGPGFFKALGVALLITCSCIGLIGGISRLMADVPPTLGGETVALAVEFRWPAGQPLPAADSAEWFLRLHSATGGTLRTSRNGPLWREDARMEDGRWIVPGAVSLFTERGDRIIDVVPDSILKNGFRVPIGRSPKRSQLEWSEWLPRKPGDDGITFRFRVVPANQPLRTEAFGPFEVTTIARWLGEVTYAGQPPMWSATAEFRIRHRGQPVVIPHRPDSVETVTPVELATAVAAVRGPTPALMVQVTIEQGVGTCYLLVSTAGAPRIERVGSCVHPMQLAPLTNDAAELATTTLMPEGRFDRTSFARSRYYLLANHLFDSETMTLRPYDSADQSQLIDRLPPIGIAPDAQSFVRAEWDRDTTGKLVLAVTRLDGGPRYRMSVDAARMRYFVIDHVDQAWLQRHFEWRHEPGHLDSLVPRASFAPMPYRGTLSTASDYREYRLGPALPGLRPAVIDWLVAEFKAERVTSDESAFAQEVKIGETVLHVSYSPDGESHVGIWMDRGPDTRLVAEIARRLDAALATYRFDQFIGQPPSSTP
ncbi:MAG: hypothetical protein IPO52_00210 [Gemmatimonadetes bacterium]|nr:hypothetical protein [Gemmatimonadota bacterium]MBP9897565.1 hypothetical protein [Gemmatimonadales bacterium]